MHVHGGPIGVQTDKYNAASSGGPCSIALLQQAGYVFDALLLCIHMPAIDRSLFVYTCRRLIDLSLIAGTQFLARTTVAPLAGVWCVFLSKNLDFQLKNLDFLVKNVDFLLKNVDFRIKQDFAEANWEDCGGKDWQDMSKGIDHLVANGLADEGRLGVLGWS